MTEQMFFRLLHKRLSQISVGASALRNQGKKGLLKKAREYCNNSINISSLIKNLSDKTKFDRYLNRHTRGLTRIFFNNGEQGWGTARKALNLFFREIVYNKFIAEKYNLPTDFDQFNKKIKYLEVPLDSNVATCLIRTDINGQIPKWVSIVSLTPEINRQFQEQASIVAERENIARVNLDLKYWRFPIK